MKKVADLLKKKIEVRKLTDDTSEIMFPMYKSGSGESYEIVLKSIKGAYILSDNGSTYQELDRIFEMEEPDVVKNLVAILKQYGCKKARKTNEFYIECSLEDIHVKLSYLIQALSFMLNMKIFYKA